MKTYLQSSGCGVWLKQWILPRELWPKEWFNNGVPCFKRPVIRLKKALYGHPEAGSHWETHLEQHLMNLGAEKLAEYPGTCMSPRFSQRLAPAGRIGISFPRHSKTSQSLFGCFVKSRMRLYRIYKAIVSNC